MKRTLYILLFLGSKVFSQDLDITLDTLVSPASEIYFNQYTLRHSKQADGEGWETRKDKTLNHIFYGETSESAFSPVGNWIFTNDSIIFFIKNKSLIKKYGHKQRESFRPFTISLNFESKTKNPSDSTQVMVYRNQIVILNSGQDVNALFMEIKTHLNSRFEHLKSKLDPTLKWYYNELNDILKIELSDFLFQKKVFSSISTSRNFE